MPAKRKAKVSAEEEKKWDVSGIELEGEEDEAVEVYDTCDELRKKIRAHLKEPGVTQAGFLREIAKTFSDGRKLSSQQLTQFLGKKGPSAGNASGVFYAGYVYFEKLRIKQKKKKSKFREEMEDIWDGTNPQNGYRRGFDFWTSKHNASYIVQNGTVVSEDKYGHVHFSR